MHMRSFLISVKKILSVAIQVEMWKRFYACELQYYLHTATGVPLKIWPLFGPVDGDTRVTMSGGNLTASDVTAVRFGHYISFNVTPRFAFVFALCSMTIWQPMTTVTFVTYKTRNKSSWSFVMTLELGHTEYYFVALHSECFAINFIV